MGMKEVSDKTFKVWLETDEHDKRAGDVKSLNRRVVLATFTSKKDADAFVDGLAHSYRGNFHRTEKPSCLPRHSGVLCASSRHSVRSNSSRGFSLVLGPRQLLWKNRC